MNLINLMKIGQSILAPSVFLLVTFIQLVKRKIALSINKHKKLKINQFEKNKINVLQGV